MKFTFRERDWHMPTTVVQNDGAWGDKAGEIGRCQTIMETYKDIWTLLGQWKVERLLGSSIIQSGV